jgi:hypothetical protein
MIKIESVTIRELRGIRELTIRPNRKCFVVSGPNGSGKSGIVDAIQFALTGEMSRLSGKGTGGISVSHHGPHVDRRDDPSAAEVALQVYVPELNISAVLTRNVKTAKTYSLNPDDPKIRAILEEVSAHPELSLSRREIIKYIIVEAGERSREIQALLKLEEIGETRGVLKTVSNKLSITQRTSERDVSNADDAFRRHLDVKSLKPQEILAAVNPRRRTLGLVEINEWAADTDLGSGTSASIGAAAFPKETSLRDIKALDDAQAHIPTLAKQEAANLVDDITTLKRDPALLDAVERRSVVERGLDFLAGPRCPLCDLEWEDEAHLRAHLLAKLAKSQAAEEFQDRMLANGASVADASRRLAGLVDSVLRIAETVSQNEFAVELSRWSADLKAFAAELGTIAKITGQHERLAMRWTGAPAALRDRIGALRNAVMEIPDLAATAAAQVFLARAQDRLAACRASRREQRRALTAVKAGNAVYRTYCDVADQYLSALYKAVEDQFAEFYRAVNTEDEGSFKARLEAAEGGLDLEVAFYDKGMFPPGAYHSEGHQDGMGVCLYLALMKRLLGTRFGFAVFDDVVMSVDHGHRKQFCRLLKTYFPDTQFIITTHDKVWAKQMYTEGLVESKAGVAFHSWSVQTGPIVEQLADVWAKIETDVAKGDIDAAAARLRRHLEYVAGEIADEITAKPSYRGDFSYDLGDLFPAVIGRQGELLKQAAKAADSWNDEAAREKVEALKKRRAAALAKYGGESWVVNKSVHYNEWAQFSKSEFQDVLNAFQGVLDTLRCAEPECGSWLYVTPKKGDPEVLRCRCGATNLNLRAK